ncbi:MAG TPA: hypothetical protein VLB44_07615 [Kofleriaceae bacterium]|nr:hypothetical protein [Kofleriaceae bacterium]
MRTVLFVLLAASACVPQPKRPTTPTEYACSGFSVIRDGSELKSGDHAVTGKLSWTDKAGEHFVSWPATPTDRQAIEFIVPGDPRQDAQQRTYDTTFGSSVSDWRLTGQQVCTAHGGYTDVLARYLKGESVDDLTRSLSLDSRDETRTLLRRAIVSLQHRYYQDY